MPAVLSLVVAVLTFVGVAMPAVALADGRVAPVVGNSTHAHIGRLPNTQNDATTSALCTRTVSGRAGRRGGHPLVPSCGRAGGTPPRNSPLATCIVMVRAWRRTTEPP